MIKKKIIINGVLTTKSGLSIGGTKDDIGINTQDNPVIKNPLTNQPYIPGSSIKGKMRSMFEAAGLNKGELMTIKKDPRTGKEYEDWHPCMCGRTDCAVCKLFGAHMNTNAKSGSPRLLFRDAYMTDEFDKLSDVIEIKTETSIDRKSGTAKTGTLRTKERIAAGVNFDYEIVILVHDSDNAAELLSLVENGLRMIEATGLGSKVTSGYGSVDFNIGADTYSVKESNFVEV